MRADRGKRKQCDTKDLVVTASVYEQLLQDKSTNQQYMPVSWSISLP